ANDFNPLSVFDISGEIDFFLRAFLKIDLFLFSLDFEYEFLWITLFKFDVTFNRPQIVGALSDDGTLTLNICLDAANRLKAEIFGDAGNDTIYGYDWDNNHASPATPGPETLDGGEGDNVIHAGAAAATEMDGGSGVDTMFAFMFSTAAHPVIDTIKAGAGN